MRSTLTELAQRIAERAQVPFAVWDGRVRMSIAGYQDKLAVYKENDRLYLADGELASTHILKPEPWMNGCPISLPTSTSLWRSPRTSASRPRRSRS